MNKMAKGREALGAIMDYEALCKVSDYAYARDCTGLTDEECETLEGLCDKAANALATDFADRFMKETE